METKDFTDLSNVTIAELHAAIYDSEQQMKNCLKNKNIKGFLETFKFNIKLTKLLDKKVKIVRKENREIGKQL